MATTAKPIIVRYEDAEHRYWLTGPGVPTMTEVPSVTTLIEDMSSAPALPWWGMRVGMAGVVEMMADVGWGVIANANEPLEIIDPSLIPPERQHFTKSDRKRKKPRSLVEAWVVDHKRSTNHVRDEAGDRGTTIHLVLEALGLEQMPKINDFPAEQRGWIAAIMQWWLDQEPRFLMNEVIVGSAAHLYAGRFDTVVEYPDGRIALVDLKTSKGVYKSHLRQLALYREAFNEMGLWPQITELTQNEAEDFDTTEVLHCRRDGSYTMVPSLYQRMDVLPTVAAWHADREGWLRHQGVLGLRGRRMTYQADLVCRVDWNNEVTDARLNMRWRAQVYNDDGSIPGSDIEGADHVELRRHLANGATIILLALGRSRRSLLDSARLIDSLHFAPGGPRPRSDASRPSSDHQEPPSS